MASEPRLHIRTSLFCTSPGVLLILVGFKLRFLKFRLSSNSLGLLAIRVLPVNRISAGLIQLKIPGHENDNYKLNTLRGAASSKEALNLKRTGTIGTTPYDLLRAIGEHRLLNKYWYKSLYGYSLT